VFIGEEPTSAAELVDAELGRLDRIAAGALPGVPTGYPDLDDLLGGWQPGQVIAVAGVERDAAVFALSAALTAAARGHQALVFTRHQREVHHRLMSACSGVPLHAIASGYDLTQRDVDRMREAGKAVASWPLYIGEVAESANVWIPCIQRDIGPGALVVVDTPDAIDDTPGLMRFAGRKDAAVMVVADRIEPGADRATAVEILLLRPDYLDSESPRMGEVDITVDQNRTGPTCTVTAAAQLHVSRFVDMSVTDISSWPAGDQP